MTTMGDGDATADPYLGVHAVNIYVKDQERSLRFYQETLGFRVAFDTRVGSGHRLLAVAPPDGTAVLTLIQPGPDSPQRRLIGRATQVVFVTEDLPATYREWRRRGVRFRSTPRLRRVVYEQAGASPFQPAAAPAAADRRPSVWGGVFARFEDVDRNSFALVSFDEVSRAVEAERRAAAAKLEAQRRAAHELEIAMQVQARLFPQRMPTMRALEYAGACVQTRRVGGDYYDFLDLGQERLGLVIGDIVGKGMPAALLMANLQANLRSQCAIAVEQRERLLQSVNRLKKSFGLFDGDGTLAAQICLKVGHQQRGRHSLSHNIADHKPEPLLPEIQKVVVVATHAPRLHARARILQRPHRGHSLRKESRLHLHGNFQFVRRATLGLQLFRGCAAFRFNCAADLVEADERKGVPIDILETRKRAAPDRRPPIGRRRHRGGLELQSPGLLIDDAAKARWAPEANAAFAPFAIRRGQILGHEHHLSGSADEPALRGIRLGLNQREHRGAVGRCDRQQPMTRPHAGVERDPESERLLVEPKAALLIFDVDVHRVNAQVGIRHRISVARCCHQRDYRLPQSMSMSGRES